MRELLVRTISGLIYMTLILFAMYANVEYYLILTGCFGLLTLFEFQRLVSIKSLLPYAIFLMLFAGIQMQVFPDWIDFIVGVLGVIMNTYLMLNLLEFMSNQRLERKYILMVFYIMIGVITMGLIPQVYGAYDMNLMAGVFILIWVNDSMAYLVGVNFGRRKLLEHISPKKTIEGTLGGVVGALITAAVMAQYFINQSLYLWIGLALLISVLGTLGDLVQSKFKRKAQVKDSGALLPGHGGIYDRLDSIIFVSPFVYCLLQIVAYVS
jgi:phosphatidate cytidylyltransferase